MSIRTSLVGYDDRSKAYRCFDLSTKKIYIRRDVVFNELKMFEFNLKKPISTVFPVTDSTLILSKQPTSISFVLTSPSPPPASVPNTTLHASSDHVLSSPDVLSNLTLGSPDLSSSDLQHTYVDPHSPIPGETSLPSPIRRHSSHTHESNFLFVFVKTLS